MESGMPSGSEQKNWVNPCFASASKYEIHYKHKKIIGSAQVRKNNVLLQHGSILLNNNQELLAEFIPYLTNSRREALRRFLSQRTIAINQILNPPVHFWEFASKLRMHFEKELAIRFETINELNKYEKEVYQQLLLKYETNLLNN
jgi:lipoate-protein ligase A